MRTWRQKDMVALGNVVSFWMIQGVFGREHHMILRRASRDKETWAARQRDLTHFHFQKGMRLGRIRQPPEPYS